MLLQDLHLRYAGRPIVVVGGGPSAPLALGLVQRAACVLSTNQHGALLTRCDAVVCQDDIEAKVAPFGLPIISPRRFADFRIADFGGWCGNTGLLAIWVAWMLGGYPIIAAGLDCYTGDTYHHDPDAESPGRELQPETFVLRARGAPIPPTAVVRLLGETPLLTVWPSFDDGEALPPFVPPPAPSAERRTVRWRRQEYLGRSLYETGEQTEVTQREADDLLARYCVEIIR